MYRIAKNDVYKAPSSSWHPHKYAIVVVCIAAVVFSSCTPTYEANTLENSIRRICKKEYDIDNVSVKIVGKTLGVYLPLEKLFSANLDALTSNDGEASVEDLFRFNPDAMEVIEDVLFTTSRVILSTDRNIDFYVLKAGESETTGIELILTGYVTDMKRVRFWDISISEYRKRLLHDLSINRTVVWKRTVNDFFGHVGRFSLTDLLATHFTMGVTLHEISPFFYAQLVEADFKDNLRHELLKVRTKPISQEEVLVYVQVKETFQPREGYEQYHFLFANGSVHEYLFILRAEQTAYKIHQVIPFYFIDDNRMLQTLEFPADLKIYDNIDTWGEEFELHEILLGDFLARQLTKRLQALIATTQELNKAFNAQKFAFIYHDQPGQSDTADDFVKSFSVVYESNQPHIVSRFEAQQSKAITKDVRLLIEFLLKEFSHVTYSYKFNDYQHLKLYEVRTLKELTFPKSIIEQFRTKELTLDTVLNQII